MAHYAKVVNGKVTAVLVADQSFIDSYQDPTPELNKYPSSWVKTSYNTRGGVHYQPNTNLTSSDQSLALRGNYAGIGFTYDSTHDAFYAPQPYPSWTLNEETCIWEPPVEYPNDDIPPTVYNWNETDQQWDETT